MTALARNISMILLVAICVFLADSEHGTPVSTSGSKGERESKREQGPDFERQYFTRWHFPQDLILGQELLNRTAQEIQSLPSEEETGSSVNSWTPLGPYGMFTANGARYTGRVLDLEVDVAPSLRIATASGGLWQYYLGFPVAMTEKLSSPAAGSFASMPGNPNTIFLGTGEPAIRGGSGLWKTTNGGTSWIRVPLDPEPWTFFRMRYRPRSSSVIFAATDVGLFRTTDGGTSWTSTLPGTISDLAFHPANPDTILVHKWGSGIYKTTDNGVSWNRLLGGLPTTVVGRGSLTICAQNPNVMYAAFARDTGAAVVLGVYKSTNLGTSWNSVTPQTNYMGSQGWYNNVIAVSPGDPNIVLAGGVSLLRSTNGGASWNEVTSGDIHADHHVILWKRDGRSVWSGNDGGVFYSSDKGETWTSTANLLPITQYVNIDVGVSDVRVMAGGSQDNGVSVSVDGGNTWEYTLPGDGAGITIDMANPQRIYVTGGYWNGDWAFRRFRSTNTGSTWADINNGVDPEDQWYTQMRSDRTVPIYLFTNSGPHVYGSENNGDSWVKYNTTPFIRDISNIQLSRHTNGGATIYAAIDASAGQRLMVRDSSRWFERSAGLPPDLTVRSAKSHPTDTRVAYALMNGYSPGNKVFRTTNRGVTWTNISNNMANVAMGDIVIHPRNGNLLYIGTESGCFRTTNGGALWQRWNNGMPEVSIVTEMTYIDSSSQSNGLYIIAGTYGRGMWKRDISGDDPTAVQESRGGTPEEFRLLQNYPNPFNPSTRIEYEVPTRAFVELKVFDVLGREIAVLVGEEMQRGRYSVEWDARNFPSGVYFSTLRAGGFSATKKMMLVK